MDVLTDKQYKSYSKISRYSPFPFYYNRLDNKYVYGTTLHLNKNVQYTLHTVKQGDTPDKLALIYYNNPTYYWIILDFNRLQDPFKELPENMLLKIPNFSSIEFSY